MLADDIAIHTMVPMNTTAALPQEVKPAMSQEQPTPGPLKSVVTMLAGIVLRYPAAIKPPNFTMVGGMSLFAGARYPLWQALAIPLAVMAISDMWLKLLFNYHPFNWFVYGSFAVYVLLGRLLRRTQSPLKIGTVSLLASLQFFLITNFGVWYSGIGRPDAMFEPNLAGLLACYAMALPFMAFSIAGDLGFAAILFGRMPTPRPICRPTRSSRSRRRCNEIRGHHRVHARQSDDRCAFGHRIESI